MARRFLTESQSKSPKVSRRGLLTGLLVGGALTVGWRFWPRSSLPNLAAAPGETVFNAFVKIGRDGHVTIVSPQIEMGQGSATILAQIAGDELGADWRTIAVEPAPINDIYNNQLLMEDWKDGWKMTPQFQVTGGSSTLRSFAPRLRRAAAGARTLLQMAAADLWDASWEACDTEEGFVFRGNDRMRFGELVEAAAGFELPSEVPLRSSGKRLAGRGVNRLDVPAKLDGSSNFAADIRLPDMVYAAIHQAPAGASKLTSFNAKAALKLAGVVSVIDTERWIAVAANSWWIAEQALRTVDPKFSSSGAVPNQKTIEASLAKAMKAKGSMIFEAGNAAAVLETGKPIEYQYSVGFAQHAALEPLTATAHIEAGMLQLWISTQSPGLARKAAARASELNEEDVVVHAMPLGGSFGRKYEVEIAAQAALLAKKLERPVQLIWSRDEDMGHDRPRPAARAKMSAKLAAGGLIEAWRSQIATSDGVGEMVSRNVDLMTAHDAQQARTDSAEPRVIDGALPPYAIPNFEATLHPADFGVPTGKLRGGAHGASCFFNESFIDELAHKIARDPFSFRIGLLTGNARMARCLATVSARGGWNGGGQGTNQGLACHAMQGSFIAVLAEAQMGDNGRPLVTKLTAVADVGYVMNPDIARQQIEGGLLYGLGVAVAQSVTSSNGFMEPRRLRDLGPLRLADMPEISVAIIRSKEAPGGIGELAVPPVGPAIANALFAGSGQRYRSLPLGQSTR